MTTLKETLTKALGDAVTDYPCGSPGFTGVACTDDPLRNHCLAFCDACKVRFGLSMALRGLQHMEDCEEVRKQYQAAKAAKKKGAK